MLAVLSSPLINPGLLSSRKGGLACFPRRLSLTRRIPRRPVCSTESSVSQQAAPSRTLFAPENELQMALPPLPSIGNFKRVVLVRHGQSTWNKEGRIQGSSDFAVLTPKGEDQAQTIRQALANDAFDVCFRSPLARAAKTADIICQGRDLPLLDVDEIREIDLYSFQGLLKQEGVQRFGTEYVMWKNDPSNFVIDGHYPVRELWTRANAAWATVLAAEGASILVVAHNAVIQAMVATALGIGPSFFRTILQSNCGVSVLDFSPPFAKSGSRGVNGGGDASAAPRVLAERLNQTPAPPVMGASCEPPLKGPAPRVRLLLVRNGHSCDPATSLPADWPDVFPSGQGCLSMLGKIQARKTAELLVDVPVDAVWCAQSCMASEATALELVELQEAAHQLLPNLAGGRRQQRAVDVKFMDELRERDYGLWQGCSPTEVARSFPNDWEDWCSDPQTARVTEGETMKGFMARARAAYMMIEAETPPNKTSTVVLVAPLGMLRALLCCALGLPSSMCYEFYMSHGSLTVLDFAESMGAIDGQSSARPELRCLNYTVHHGRWAVPVTQLPAVNGDTDEF